MTGRLNVPSVKYKKFIVNTCIQRRGKKELDPNGGDIPKERF